MKKAWLVIFACFISTALISQLPLWLLPLKYLALAYGIVLGSSLLLQYFSIPKPSIAIIKTICKWCSLCIIIIYTILVIDTFWFHALTWFPGLLRYPIMDAYGLCNCVFIIPGVLWYLGTPIQRKVEDNAKV